MGEWIIGILSRGYIGTTVGPIPPFPPKHQSVGSWVVELRTRAILAEDLGVPRFGHGTKRFPNPNGKSRDLFIHEF